MLVVWCVYCLGLGWFMLSDHKWWAILLWPIIWPIGWLNDLENKL